MTEALVSIGVAAALGPERIARIAAAAESAQFHALWVNDTPGADALAALTAAAAATDSLTLATGVLPVDRRSAADIAAEARDLPQERLVLGIGSGGARVGALDLVRAAIATLRSETTARVLVGALGPRMRALAAADADGPLLSWLTPDAAARQAALAHADGGYAALYIRTALDEAASGRLADEAARYGSYPAYAANLARLGIAAADTVLAPGTFADGIRRYRDAVDEVVLRAIVPDDGEAEYVRFIEQAAVRLDRATGVSLPSDKMES
jgi:alkanesulfonate monooxygenase SsuD/methylene tetrahydromethanopterin reductase-like flavin-dependent oxidoreductase (luciferase family)